MIQNLAGYKEYYIHRYGDDKPNKVNLYKDEIEGVDFTNYDRYIKDNSCEVDSIYSEDYVFLATGEERLIRFIRRRKENDKWLEQNMGLEGYYGLFWDVQVQGVILDDEYPLEGAFARLLLVSPYKKLNYPNFREYVGTFLEARRLRSELIHTIKDYELYSNGKIVFKKSGNKLHYFDKPLFEELCAPSKKLWLEIIDENFIENVIVKGYVPENCRNKLRKYIGYQIEEAIKVKSGNYGNIKQLRKIHKEVDILEPVDRFLFYTIFDTIVQLHSTKTDHNENWSKLQNRYKCLASDDSLASQKVKNAKQSVNEKLYNFYGYFLGKIEVSSLNLRKENFGEVLRITKMFELAKSLFHSTVLPNSLINTPVLRKGEYRIEIFPGSYKLKQIIFNEMPNLSSPVVFSKTLFYQRCTEVSYLADKTNWDNERVGLHARMIANTLILAKSLSESRIIGARGNTASGKSFALGKKVGILNTDPIKASLRRGTGVRNHQIHLEGATLFDLCFDEIANRSTLHYIVDLRMIRLEDISTYLIEPARKRNCTVFFNDFDVPLLTTLNRVLKRDPRGEDPVPSLEPMRTGFINIRKYREQVVRYVEVEEVIEEYTLYYLGQIVAKKEHGKMIYLEGYEECLRVPSDEEIEISLNRTIDDAYIQEAIDRGDIKPEEKEFIELWKGITVRDALQTHANS